MPFKTTPITELGFNSNPMVDALTRWQIPVSKVADVPNAVRKALAGQPRVAPGRMPPQIRGLCRLGGIVWGIRKSAPLGATPKLKPAINSWRTDHCSGSSSQFRRRVSNRKQSR